MSAEWIRPRTLQEALAIRSARHVRPLAGATDLYVRYRGIAGTLPALSEAVMYIGHLNELTAISVHEHQLRIGAAAVYTDVAAHPATPGILKNAIAELGAPALRNVGTLGGNIGNASPAADAVCTLYALDAQVELASLGGARRVPIDAVITGPGQTAIAEDELITAILVPLGYDSFSFYRKVGTRRANALSKLAFAACGEVEDYTLGNLGVAIAAVGPTVIRSRELEERMRGADGRQIANLRNELIAGYLALVAPISDQRSTAQYRRWVTENLLIEFLDRCLPSNLNGPQ